MIKRVIQKGGTRTIVFLGLLVLFEIIAEAAVTIVMPHMRGSMMDALLAKQAAAFYGIVPLVAAVMAAYATLNGFKRVYVAKLSAQIRVGMTKVLTKHWVHNKDSIKADNPDGRIAEDIRVCTDRFFVIMVEVAISAIIVVGLIGTMLHSKALLIVAVAYIGLAFAISHMFKKPLVNSKTELQMTEQDFRTALSKIRQGTGDYSFKRLLENVRVKYVKYMFVTGMYWLFFGFKNAALVVIPILVMFPMYLKGTLTNGDLFSGLNSFDLLVTNATVIMGYYTDVTDAKASYGRVIELLGQGG